MPIDLDGVQLMIDSGRCFPFEGNIIVVECCLILDGFHFNSYLINHHWISLRNGDGVL